MDAYEAVVYGKLSTQRAALEFGVPQSTLVDWVTGRIPFGKASGPKRYLDDSEEEELIRFIERSAEIGYGYSQKQVIALVQDVVNAKGMSELTVTTGWWKAFRRRHPELSLRKPEAISVIRARCTHTEALEKYFQELEKTLVDNDLMSSNL